MFVTKFRSDLVVVLLSVSARKGEFQHLFLLPNWLIRLCSGHLVIYNMLTIFFLSRVLWYIALRLLTDFMSSHSNIVLSFFNIQFMALSMDSACMSSQQVVCLR
jgi:hypothetical protein